DKVYEQRQASSSLISGIIRTKLTNHKRKYTPKDIIDDVKSDLGVDVSYMLAWRAKEKAMNFLRGEPADSYKKLPGYLYTMDKTYPVDGSHLKPYYTWTFVSASTLDGAGYILPLTYGVIDSENDAAWTWFFEQFKIAYGVRENMCIVSDRNESIIKSVSRVYPDLPHCACIWHLWNNVYKKFKKSHAKLSEIYFSMAKTYTQTEFDSLMEKVEKVDIRVKEYLELAGYEKWVRLYAPVNRGWTMTSNIESINATLVSARELPIYDFLEEVRKMFGRWNCSNRKEATHTYKTLGKKYQEMLELNETMCTRMTVVPSTEYLHTVNDGGRNYTSKFLMPEEYCSSYYKPSTIVMTYDVPVYPLPDKNDWNIPEHVAEEVVLPPKWKRPPGRPKKKRDKNLSELLLPKNQHSCSICGQGGHNKRTCRNAPRNK
uniref:MULE transposase domain-containing protein n=1 Tax=Nicotiana tabacum TaxID=4097 RepID=A0A1S4CM73_TOBAC